MKTLQITPGAGYSNGAQLRADDLRRLVVFLSRYDYRLMFGESSRNLDSIRPLNSKCDRDLLNLVGCVYDQNVSLTGSLEHRASRDSQHIALFLQDDGGFGRHS